MTSPENWWENFFTGLVVEFWRAVQTPEGTRAEAECFEKRLGLRPGAAVLDVPCGDGRLSLELLRRGYRMTGVDISEDFLSAARESAQRERLSISWRHSDMRDLPWTAEFDGAFCAGSSFGFLGDAGDAAFLEAVFRSLKPGASLLLDGLKAAEVLLPNFRERHEIKVGDIHFAAESRYDAENGRIENRYTTTRGGQSETRLAWHRIYTYRELLQMLRAAGFCSIEGFGSLSGDPFRLGAQRLLLVARKEGL
ncbi:MAG TPA: methyltransferase domain-containing protein [Thermoanaerobaculia bacterium]|nr:methyltransferase domain-containing protein [Thermoanaerobaculia bacterium]